MNTWLTLLEPVVGYLFPGTCAHCKIRPRLDDFLCDDCKGWAFPPQRLVIHPIPGVLCLHRLNPPVRSLIHGLKYLGWKNVAEYLCENARLDSADFPKDKNWIPVPIHSARLRERGYNQSELIVRSLRKVWGGRMYLGILKRSRYAVSQTRLDRKERMKNIRNCFRARGPLPESILLVDDVFTTGATTDACKDALLRAGASQVQVVTLAFEPKDSGREDWILDQEMTW